MLPAVLAALMLAAAGPAGTASDPVKLKADVAEARGQGRQVMVFLHRDNCPYCARMLEENFVSGDNHDFMRKLFDVIAVNVRGSLEVR